MKMEYILSLDNNTQIAVNYNGSHTEAIKKFTGEYIGNAQVLCVYESKK